MNETNEPNEYLELITKKPTAKKSSFVQGEPGTEGFNEYYEMIKNRPHRESTPKAVARFGLQGPLGYATKYTWPLNAISAIGQGEALAEYNELEERLPQLMKQFPTAPWENFQGLDKEKYMEAVHAAGQYFPTQQNIEEFIEKQTGLPLRPKTEFDKGVRLAGTAAGLRGGDVVSKGIAAITAPLAKKGLEELGVPEAVAEPVSLVASGVVPSPSLAKQVKPSGLAQRGFESTTKPKKVSPARMEKITEAVEKDFKKLSEGLLEKNKTYSALKDDTLFKEKVSNMFEKVEDLAKNIKGDIQASDLRSTFHKRYNARDVKGISPDEFERAFRKEVRAINKSIPHDNITPTQLVEQYRKNNKSLGELFEPGKSSAFNRAKKEALLEYNRSIEDVITKKYPDSEFKDLFQFTNKRWQEISDIEQIDKFTENLFNGKINFKEAKKLFLKDKPHVARPFKRILGEEGFKDFKALTEDLLSYEAPLSLIKKAESEGFKDLGRLAGEYILHPKLAKGHLLAKSIKSAYQMLLDKPKYAVTWKNALDNFKAGNFKEAEKDFKKLDEANHQK